MVKWDIRFCALQLDPASFDFRLNYYRNQMDWQAGMPAKGSVGVGLSQVSPLCSASGWSRLTDGLGRMPQVELLRSIEEPVDYRMTIRTRDRLFSFRASLKDLKVRSRRLQM